MRVVTLQRPWPWAIFGIEGDDWKDVENRSRMPPVDVVGEWVAVHAGLKFDAEGARFIKRHGIEIGADALVQGAIVGVVKVAGVVQLCDIHAGDAPRVTYRLRAGLERCVGQARSSRWAFGRFCICIGDRRAIEPIPHKGQRGWMRLPAAVEHAVRDAAGL